MIKEKVDDIDTSVEALRRVQKSPSHKIASPHERAKAFREWAKSHPHNTPLLSDEAISRESIYGERG
jgi:hypothetical protein